MEQLSCVPFKIILPYSPKSNLQHAFLMHHSRSTLVTLWFGGFFFLPQPQADTVSLNLTVNLLLILSVTSL